jgi:uncharacterized protein YprB with RNaseH-like and TPR domain
MADRLRRAEVAAPLVAGAAARPPFLFFDLETTGLNGGAGTHAFLVGCGWFDEAGGFVTRQHLLASYGAERSMLQAVSHELDRAGALVTFNGKSFDAPLLDTRYVFHRLQSPCGRLPHVDVLHPARRFWGGIRLKVETTCSLVNLEQQVLGARRVGDVPGFEIPGRYFQFVRNGDARPLCAVLEHNRLDLLSLAGLTARLLHLVESGPGETRDAREALALGRVYAQAGLDDRSDHAFEHAVKMCGERGASDVSAATQGNRRAATILLKIDALRSLAVAARRRRRYDAAALWWQDVLDVPGCPGPIAREATEALAIHHEHRARDLAAAKRFALKSLEFEPEAAWGDAVRHRLARIERKILSEQKPALFPSWPSRPSCGSLRSGRRTFW